MTRPMQESNAGERDLSRPSYYHAVQDNYGIAVYVDQFLPDAVYDHGIFKDFANVQWYFHDNFKGTGASLKTNFNGQHRNCLLRILNADD